MSNEQSGVDAPSLPGDVTQSVLIDGTAYDLPMAVACEMLRLHMELRGATQPAPQGVPDGWKLVPLEPTIAMCIAGDGARVNVDDATRTPAVYRTMLAAAPAAPQAEPQQQPAPAFGDEDHVAVPRMLIAAACSAIDRKRDAAKTLAELRRYTTGDLSTALPVKQPAVEYPPLPAPAIALGDNYFNTDQMRAFADATVALRKHEIIADFLKRAGRYVTNDASREAAIADAVAEDRAARAAPTQVDTPKGFALVPTRPTRAMDDVMDAEGWQWEDLLAAAAGVEYLEADAPTQVDAGAETGARAALFDAQHAIQDLLSWDAQRGFPLTYKVRDPLHVVLRSCLDALAAQGGQEAEPVAKIVMNRYGGKKTEWFDAQEAAEVPVGTLIYARPPRTQGHVPTRGYSLSAIDAETVARALERVARLDAGNGMYAKPGNQPEWKIARKLWTFLKHGQQGDAQADADKLDFMERQRVLVAPEYEGQWEALVYGDQEKPSIKGTGNTPRAAIADAIARQNGKDGAA